MKILAIGDVHGDFDGMVRLMEMHKPDLCVQVGDLEPVRDESDLQQLHVPERYRRIKGFPPYWSRERRIPVPTVFISGNHEPFGFLEQHDPALGGDPYIIPKLRYLGRWGVIDVDGIVIAGLSGNFGAADFNESSTVRREKGKRTGWRAARGNSHFRHDEIDSLIVACRGRKVDILLTHEWPAGLVSEKTAQEIVASSRGITAEHAMSYGQNSIRKLVDVIRPSYLFAGHIHRRFRGQIGRTEVECLGIIHQGAAACCLVEIEK